MRSNKRLLGPANATVLTVITSYVSEYWLLNLTHLCHSNVNILNILTLSLFFSFCNKVKKKKKLNPAELVNFKLNPIVFKLKWVVEYVNMLQICTFVLIIFFFLQ